MMLLGFSHFKFSFFHGYCRKVATLCDHGGTTLANVSEVIDNPLASCNSKFVLGCQRVLATL
jgi:hypothetical protein